MGKEGRGGGIDRHMDAPRLICKQEVTVTKTSISTNIKSWKLFRRYLSFKDLDQWFWAICIKMFCKLMVTTSTMKTGGFFLTVIFLTDIFLTYIFLTDIFLTDIFLTWNRGFFITDIFITWNRGNFLTYIFITLHFS